MSGLQHLVRYTQPDGTLDMNIQAHMTGQDSDGIEYVFNGQRHMEHFNPPPLGPGVPFNDRFTENLISKGSTVNAEIIMTYTMSYSAIPTITVTTCRG